MSPSCKKIRHSHLGQELPPLYEDLLPDRLKGLQLHESEVDCTSCSMLSGEFAREKGLFPYAFSPYTKCCTYHPFVPNYMVGHILEKGGEGRELIFRMIGEKAFVLPLGLVPSTQFKSEFLHKPEGSFGRATEFTCPFYAVQSGGCKIWASRGSQCATFFCTSTYGGQPQKFWEGLQDVLFHTEMLLSQEAMLNGGFSWSEVEQNLTFLGPSEPQTREAVMPTPQWLKLWAHRMEDIPRYFCETYQFVAEKKSDFKKRVAEFEGTQRLLQEI